MDTILYIFLSVLLVSAVSLIGVVTLSLKESVLQKGVFLFVGLATGALLGDALIHLIPESFEEISNPVLVSTYILAGVIFFFILEKFLQWHHHCSGDDLGHFSHHEEKIKGSIKPLGILILVSDGMHNMIDGVIISASYMVSIEVGIATTIAVILHEIPQEISDFGLLIHAGFSKTKALLVNFGSALTAVVGALIPLVLNNVSENFLPIAIAFAAGNFLYIAGSDLVPELHKTVNAKRSITQFLMMLLGIGLMYALLFLE